MARVRLYSSFKVIRAGSSILAEPGNAMRRTPPRRGWPVGAAAGRVAPLAATGVDWADGTLPTPGGRAEDAGAPRQAARRPVATRAAPEPVASPRNRRRARP